MSIRLGRVSTLLYHSLEWLLQSEVKLKDGLLDPEKSWNRDSSCIGGLAKLFSFQFIGFEDLRTQRINLTS